MGTTRWARPHCDPWSQETDSATTVAMANMKMRSGARTSIDTSGREGGNEEEEEIKERERERDV